MSHNDAFQILERLWKRMQHDLGVVAWERSSLRTRGVDTVLLDGVVDKLASETDALGKALDVLRQS